MNMNEEREQITIDGRIFHPNLAGVGLDDPNLLYHYANEVANNNFPKVPGTDSYGDAKVLHSDLEGIPLTDPNVGKLLLWVELGLTEYDKDEVIPLPSAVQLNPENEKLVNLSFLDPEFGIKFLELEGRLEEYAKSLKESDRVDLSKGSIEPDTEPEVKSTQPVKGGQGEETEEDVNDEKPFWWTAIGEEPDLSPEEKERRRMIIEKQNQEKADQGSDKDS
jgi:hypothetical protein